ncbi:MAG TPA: TonB-dependent receptor plug domain-containing protein, partial [Fusobacterium sp.]|uniref:TonB-dependent receptor plug domain-containing protein n=1 Tax=Fusobacterium sp. TaxID=68766 RepID=UPI002F42E47C
MKKEMILTLLCFASLQAMAATQEVELNPTKIHGGGATFSGSVLSDERKNTVIITDKDIEKKQYKNVTEIFEDSPLTIVTHTPAGPVVALRGSGEKTIMRVKVLVDGNSMTSIDESMGVIPFNAIPTGSIKRIEIIPGGGISLYGSGTASGVINIVTKMGEAKDYGSVNISAGSFDTYKAEVSKGIRINPHLFTNISVEAKKGKGYREREKEERVNVMGGLNIDINPRHRMRFSGSYFHENAEGTNEAFLSEIKKNRKHPGDTLAKTKSKRYTAGIDYEYTPTENLTFTAGMNESKLTRDVKADAKPYLTFTPGSDFLPASATPKGYKMDIVLLNIPHKTSGKIEEEIKNAKWKTEYRYKENQGKLTFGMDYSNHRLKRELDIKAGPFRMEEMNFLITKKEERDFSKGNLKEGENLYNMDYVTIWSLCRDTEQNQKLSKHLEEFLYPRSSKESQEKYDNGYGLKSFQNDPDYEINLWKAAYAFYGKKVMDLIDTYEKNGKKGIYVVDDNILTDPSDPDAEFKEIPEDLTIEKLNDFLVPGVMDEFKNKNNQRINHVQSRVDVKKDTSSFYLHNSYPVTDKLNINAGLRYEHAKYKGYRESESTMYFLAKKGETPGMYTYRQIESYLDTSEEFDPKNKGDIIDKKLAELSSSG